MTHIHGVRGICKDGALPFTGQVSYQITQPFDHLVTNPTTIDNPFYQAQMAQACENGLTWIR